MGTAAVCWFLCVRCVCVYGSVVHLPVFTLYALSALKARCCRISGAATQTAGETTAEENARETETRERSAEKTGAVFASACVPVNSIMHTCMHTRGLGRVTETHAHMHIALRGTQFTPNSCLPVVVE